jgi:hypothetical protein
MGSTKEYLNADGPLYFKDIEYVQIDEYEIQKQALIDICLQRHDISYIADEMLKIGQFNFELTPEYLRILGYR